MNFIAVSKSSLELQSNKIVINMSKQNKELKMFSSIFAADSLSSIAAVHFYVCSFIA